MEIKNTPEYKSFVSKIRVTGFRLAMMSFLYWSLIGIFSASILAVLYLIADRVFYPVAINMSILIPVLAGVTLGFGLFGLFRRFPSLLLTAIRIDEYLQSDERISSAFLVPGKTPFEQALIYEAMLTLRDGSVSGMLKKDFRKISAFACAGLTFLTAFFFLLPTLHYFMKDKINTSTITGSLVDVVRILNHSESEWQRVKESNEVIDETAKLLESYEELKNRLKIANAKKNQFHNPKKQKELLSELSSLRDKIEKERKEIERLQKDVENMKKQAKNSNKENKPDKDDFEKKMEEFEKNLREGEFQDASKTMQNLLDAIKESEKSQELKDELSKKLSELAEQFSSQKMQDMLSKMAQNLEGLDLNQLSNKQMQDLLDSLSNMGDLAKLMNNKQLMEMLEDQLKNAQNKMTGG